MKATWNNRYVMYWLGRIIGVILPFLYILDTYGLFKQKSLPFTIPAIMGIAVVLLAFYKDFLKYLSRVKGVFAEIDGGIKTIMALWITVIILFWAKSNLHILHDIFWVWALLRSLAQPLYSRHAFLLPPIDKDNDK